MANRPFPSFLVFLDEAGEYRWHYQHSGNHKIVADSGEGYKTFRACAAGINMLKQRVRTAPIDFTDEVALRRRMTG